MLRYRSTVGTICYFVTPDGLDEHSRRLIRFGVEKIYSSKFLFTVLVNAGVAAWKMLINGVVYAKGDPKYDQLEQFSYWYNIVDGQFSGLYYYLQVSKVPRIASILLVVGCAPLVVRRKISLTVATYVGEGVVCDLEARGQHD